MGYKVRVNGEVVWESEGSEHLVNEISVSTPRGEAALIRVPPTEEALDLRIDLRSVGNKPMDLVDAIKADSQSDMVTQLENRFGGGSTVETEDDEPAEPAEVTF